MKYFDSHCDTLFYLSHNKMDFYNTDGHVSNQKRSGLSYAQFFALWDYMDMENGGKHDPEYKYNALKNQIKLLHDCEAIELVRSAGEIQALTGRDKVAGFLSVEGGEMFDCDISRLEWLYDRGVRVIQPVWNYTNAFCASCGEQENGMTKLGFDFVKEAENLGIILDVSHMSRAAFYDLVGKAKRPVIASHSNCAAVCNHRRNLTDEQIKILADMGGYIGLNLYANFVDEENADVSSLFRHIDHFASLGAEKILGVGADFDGCDKLPAGIDGIQDMAGLGLNSDIMFNNLYRFMEKNLV